MQKQPFLLLLQFGVTPIEFAASEGRRDMVEMLFPLTSPIPTLLKWSIDGIISHVKSFGLNPRVCSSLLSSLAVACIIYLCVLSSSSSSSLLLLLLLLFSHSSILLQFYLSLR
jgi:hypothetical protein